MLATLSPYKRFIVTGLLVLFSLGFLGFYTQNDQVSPALQSLIVSLAFFLVIPFLYSKIVLKESLKNLGWHKGNVFLGILSAMISVAVALVVVFCLTRYTDFQEEYIFAVAVETSFWWFLLYELVLVSLTALLYEVFFRGLIQLVWLRHLGLWAVLFQALLFVGLAYLSSDISWQRLPMLLFSPLSGLIAYYSGSIWYSWGAAWFFFFLTDVFLLVLK